MRSKHTITRAFSLDNTSIRTKNYNQLINNILLLVSLSLCFMVNAQGNFTINNGATFIINSDAYMTVEGNYDSSAGTTVTLNSGSSIIVNGTSSGDLTYNRTLGTDNWYLISSPVAGQDIDSFVEDTSLAFGSSGTSNLGLGDYGVLTAGWTYYQSGASGTGDFISGDGKAIKLVTANDISFTGTIDVDNLGVNTPMHSSQTGYNLLGNPYPSYIPANELAHPSNNILQVNDVEVNGVEVDHLTEATIWIWDQSEGSEGSYDVINQTSPAMFLAPGQGFFVHSNGNSDSFSFRENMQSHQSDDTFQRPSTRPEIVLTMNNGSITSDTDIYYINGKEMGWDNGYDSSIFGGAANNFKIYTHLVSDSEGQNLGIQTLPDNNFENMVIPVGINSVSGTEITISAQINNFPEGINVYLEDKENNSFTLLDVDSSFKNTLLNDEQGIGRFYIHTTSGTLSSEDLSTATNISIYNLSRESLRIVGVQTGKASIQLYSIIGKEVLSNTFEGQGINDIGLPNLSEGVYIVRLATETGIISKKIIIE